MAETHDKGAIDSSSIILNKIRSGDSEFKQIFTDRFHRAGFTGWPKADAIFKDYFDEKEITIGLEYKPPYQEKREYMTGVGQAISYLYHNDYAGLIIPKFSKDNFPISDFVIYLINKRNEINQLPICIFDYDPKIPISSNNLFLRKKITHKNDYIFEKKDDKGRVKVFWAWWRDLSNFEIYDILSLCKKYDKRKSEDIYTKYVWPEFKYKLESGKALTWEGIPRKRPSIPPGEKQNYKIPLFQLGFINQDTGHLTQYGFRFLNLCEQVGPDSKIFMQALGNHILTEGKHMQLIDLIYYFQEKIMKEKKEFKSSEHKKLFDNYLVEVGQVPPWEERKPGRKTTDGKQHYIRDEFKLWNKLGFLCNDKKKYFRDNYGLQFDWPKIIETYNFDIHKFI